MFFDSLMDKDFDDGARASWAQRRGDDQRALSDDPGYAEFLDRADQVRVKAIFNEL
jgi:hypothetical protein